MQSGIYFFKADIKFRFSKSVQVSNWIKAVIRKEGKRTGEISIIFCSDKYLLGLNQRFLNHDYYTDVITFSLSEKGLISGEVYISIERVNANSLEFGPSFQAELRRVIIHGVLHLLGYSDSTKALKNAMRLKEDACLSLLSSFT